MVFLAFLVPLVSLAEKLAIILTDVTQAFMKHYRDDFVIGLSHPKVRLCKTHPWVWMRSIRSMGTSQKATRLPPLLPTLLDFIERGQNAMPQ